LIQTLTLTHTSHVMHFAVTCPTCGTVTPVKAGVPSIICPECQDWLPVEQIPDALPVESPKKRKPFPVWVLPVCIPIGILGVAQMIAAAGGLPEDVPVVIIARLAWVVLLLMLAAAYFVPILVAISRGHPNAAPIAVLNVLLGWTFLGWVAALVWSLTAIERRPASYAERRREPWPPE